MSKPIILKESSYNELTLAEKESLAEQVYKIIKNEPICPPNFKIRDIFLMLEELNSPIKFYSYKGKHKFVLGVSKTALIKVFTEKFLQKINIEN